MAEKSSGANWQKWGLIIGALIFIVLAITAVVFIFFLPSFYNVTEEGVPLEPAPFEVVIRSGTVIGVILVGLVFLGGVAWIIYEFFFKKRELHIVKEHHKVISESAMLNPVQTLGRLMLTGGNKIQSYSIGKIIGHTQVPVKYERSIILDANGKINEDNSESEAAFTERKIQAEAEGRDKYDFFAFITRKGIYALPIFNMLEPPKIFACYPCERTPDLVGDVEIYDVGTWKVSGVNLFVPGQRHQEPMHTVREMEGQLFPIAYMGLIDYLGLVAQRGIEGDTSMQKWLQAKASTVNINERSD